MVASVYLQTHDYRPKGPQCNLAIMPAVEQDKPGPHPPVPVPGLPQRLPSSSPLVLPGAAPRHSAVAPAASSMLSDSSSRLRVSVFSSFCFNVRSDSCCSRPHLHCSSQRGGQAGISHYACNCSCSTCLQAWQQAAAPTTRSTHLQVCRRLPQRLCLSPGSGRLLLRLPPLLCGGSHLLLHAGHAGVCLADDVVGGSQPLQELLHGLTQLIQLICRQQAAWDVGQQQQQGEVGLVPSQGG